MARRRQLYVLRQVPPLTLLVLFVIILQEAHLILLWLTICVKLMQHIIFSIVILLVTPVNGRQLIGKANDVNVCSGRLTRRRSMLLVANASARDTFTVDATQELVHDRLYILRDDWQAAPLIGARPLPLQDGAQLGQFSRKNLAYSRR